MEMYHPGMRVPHSPPGPHDHSFGQEESRAGERRTWIVVVLTAATMVVEIVAGVAFGSMALLADGLHMASHSVALTIAAVAYVYARKHAFDGRFSFGTGKVNSLAGFTGAVLLFIFAFAMAWESVKRFLFPTEIAFDQALIVAGVGLLVNLFSAVILGGHHVGHSHEHGHDHDDHNLRAAYLHVIADAVTSLAAIVALLAGKYLGLAWMDPAMGIVGAILVARWSIGLIRDSGRVLLDHQAPEELREELRAALEAAGASEVTDLHLWSVGPGIWSLEVALVDDERKPPGHYKASIPESFGVVHATVEVNEGAGGDPH